MTSLHTHGERILVCAGKATGAFTILYSDDDGATWTEGTYGDVTISMTTFASVSEDTLYAFGYSIFGARGLHISTDAGVSWSFITGDYSGFPLVFIPSQMAANSEKVIVSGLDNNGGVMLTEDGGLSWTSMHIFGEEGNRVNINEITEVNGDFYSAGEGFFKADFDSLKWDLVYDLEVFDALYYNDKFYGSYGVIFESGDFGVSWGNYDLFGSNRGGEKIAMIGNKLFVSIVESGNPHVVMYTDFADEVDITEGLTDYSQSTRILKWVNNSSSIFAIRPNRPELWQYKVGDVTSVENEIELNNFSLAQNYPNPFNPSTKIQYTVPAGIDIASNVSLRIFDVLGNELATLVNEVQPPGNYEVKFNAAGLSSGVYFYKLTAANSTITKKMILTK